MSLSKPANSTQDDRSEMSDLYYSCPELAQRTDLLRHLTENSNLIPLVKGAEGIGKSTFIHHLLDLAPENWISVEIDADVMLQPPALLANLTRHFGLNGRGDELMEQLVSHFDDLRHDGLLPVIIVDDAHLLPEASIITLLRLHERVEGGNPLAQILLFAQPEIDDLLKTPQLRVMNLQALQMLEMPVFNRDQTEQFLRHLLPVDDIKSPTQIHPALIEKVYRETGGLPGLIKQRARVLLGSRKERPAKPDLIELISSKTVLGGGAVLVIVLFVLIYQDSINALFSGGEDSVKVTREIRLPVDKVVPLTQPYLQAESEATRETTLAEPSPDIAQDETNTADNADTLVEQPELLKPETGEKESQPGISESDMPVEQQQITQTTEQPETAPRPDQEPKKDTNQADAGVEVAEAKAVTDSPTVDEATATPTPAAEKQEEQVAAVQSESEPESEIAAEEGKAQKAKQQRAESVSNKPASKPVKTEKPPEVPKIGPTPNMQDSKPMATKAKTPIASKPMPHPVQANDKSPSHLAKVPSDSIDARSSALSDSSSRVPAPVEERSTMLAGEVVPTVKSAQKPPSPALERSVPSPKITDVKGSHPGVSGPLREDWLLKQRATSYTIQLVGLQDENGIPSFLRRHPLNGPIAYYRTIRKGGSWFPVLYGVFPDRQEANEALNNLPENLRKSGVWVRTMGTVQKEIRTR